MQAITSLVDSARCSLTSHEGVALICIWSNPWRVEMPQMSERVPLTHDLKYPFVFSPKSKHSGCW